MLNSSVTTDKSMPEAPHDYEQMLVKLEGDIRMHIRIEQQLKLHIESVQQKLEDSEKQTNITE